MTNEFNTSADLPFQLRGGEDVPTALYNRVASINRINFLVSHHTNTPFDIREKPAEYLLKLDEEMYKRFYVNEPKDKKIDEEFCQRASQICVELENTDQDKHVEAHVEATKEFSGYLTETPKLTWVQRLVNWLNKFKVEL